MSPAAAPPVIRRLGATDLPLARGLNTLFAAAFEDAESYAAAPPAEGWLATVLAQPHVIALVALDGADVVGGLVAYELDKLERARRETYIYDLAVTATHRRRGIATALIEAVRAIAAERDAWVVYVQADYADPPAIALYERLGMREEVLHFDIPVRPRRR